MEIKCRVVDREKKRKEDLLYQILLGEQAIKKYTKQVERAKAELLKYADGAEFLNQRTEQAERYRSLYEK